MDTPAWDTQFPIDSQRGFVGDKTMPTATRNQPMRHIKHMPLGVSGLFLRVSPEGQLAGWRGALGNL